MQTRRDWFLHDDHEESGPMTEVELRQRLVESTGAELASCRVRQGSSGWHSALSVLQRFRDLAENGVYLRCRGKTEIQGPFTLERAVELLTEEVSTGETWKARLGRNELWQTADEFLAWHAKRQASQQSSATKTPSGHGGFASDLKGASRADAAEAESCEEDIIYDGILLSDSEPSRLEPNDPVREQSQGPDAEDIVLPATLVGEHESPVAEPTAPQIQDFTEPIEAASTIQNATEPMYVAPNITYASSKSPRSSGSSFSVGWILASLAVATIVMLVAGLGAYYYLLGNSQTASSGGARYSEDVIAAELGRSTPPDINSAEIANSELASAPIVPPGALFRPVFITRDGRVDAGTAFAARLPGSDFPILISALHLLGPAGGLDTQIPGDRVSQQWIGIELQDCVSNRSIGRVSGSALSLPRAEPFPNISPSGDVIAYKPTGYGNFRPYRIAEAPPRQGEYVWLVSEVIGSDTLTHRAKILPMEEGWLTYVFDDPQIELRATSGAPIINAKDQVVGVNAGGGELNGQTIGVGTPSYRFEAILRAVVER